MGFEETNEQFDDAGEPSINYWEKFKGLSIGQLKDEFKKIFEKDPAGIEFQTWIQQKTPEILKSYIWGITHGVKAATKMCLDDFASYIFIIEKTKIVAESKQPIQPKNELDILFAQDKIKDEIDSLLNDLE